MGQTHSIDESLKLELMDLDEKHNALFQKMEKLLHNERQLNIGERKEMELRLDEFVKSHLKCLEKQFEHSLKETLQLVSDEKNTRDVQYKSIVVAWRNIIASHHMEVTDASREELLSQLDLIYDKEKHISDFTYDQQVRSVLENYLHEDYLKRDQLFKELLVNLSNEMKCSSQKVCQRFNTTAYRLENEVSIKDKDFLYTKNVDIQHKLFNLINKRPKDLMKNEDLEKERARINQIVKEDKVCLDEKRQKYSRVVNSILESDKVWVDKHFQDLNQRIEKLLNDYHYQQCYLNQWLPDAAAKFIWRGEDLLYQRYRCFKTTLFDVIRNAVDLGQTRKNELIDQMSAHRRLFKTSNESILNTQHNQIKNDLTRIYVEQGSKLNDDNKTYLTGQLQGLMAYEKDYIRTRRESIQHQLENTIRHDQVLSDEKVRSIVLKMDSMLNIKAGSASVSSSRTTSAADSAVSGSVGAKSTSLLPLKLPFTSAVMGGTSTAGSAAGA